MEVTGNTRLFYKKVRAHVGRVAVVNPQQFKVISQSVKKTDTNDAKTLAMFLANDMLPEVRIKDDANVQLHSLVQTRDKLVKLRTTLKNKINNILSAHGVNIKKKPLTCTTSGSKLGEAPAKLLLLWPGSFWGSFTRP